MAPASTDAHADDAGTRPADAAVDVQAAVAAQAAGGVQATGADLSSTGDPRVDDALSRLPELDGLPLADQVEVFTDIHRRLAGVLADPDSQA